MKKKVIICTMLSLVLAGITIFSSKVNSLSTYSVSGETWGHYNAVDPTFDKNGIKEFWISCTTHNVSLTKPSTDASNIYERGTPSQSYIDALSFSDSRFLPKYQKIYDFEDGIAPKEFEAGSNVTSITVVDGVGTRGSKALKVLTSGSDYFVGFTKKYLDAAFADSSVNCIKFDCKGTTATSNFRHNTHFDRTDSYLSNPFEINQCLTTDWKTFYWTRNMYNEWKDNSTFLKGGGFNNGDYLLIDNIELSQRSFDKVSYDAAYIGFEGGYMPSLGSVRAAIGNKAASVANREVFVASGAGFNACEYSYDKKTEGNRAIKVHKISGYTQYTLTSAFYNAISDDGFYFDFYTTVGLNSNETSKAIVDGRNNILPTGNISPNRWNRLHFTKDMVTTDGRFLITQGSPEGDLYFDNFRPFESSENCESAYAYKEGEYATFADFEVNTTNYNTVRDSSKDYQLIVNSAKITDASISMDHKEDWHNRSLKTTLSGSGYCAIFLNPDFLANNFANGVSFDIYTEAKFAEGTSFSAQANKGLNTWTTVTLAGEDLYDPLKPGQNIINGRIFGLSITGAGSFYIDNIRAADSKPILKQANNDVTFEEGTISKTTSGSTAIYDFTNNSNVDFKVRGSDSYINSVSLETAPLSRPGKALKVNKNAGYVAFYFNSSLYSSMNADDVISFDLYSTIGANSKSTVNNFMSNSNGLFVGEDYAHISGRWITYNLKKADIGSDGRFLIIQGGTAGDWYFDNIKVRSNKTYLDLGTHYPELGEMVTLNVGVNIPSNTVVKVDDEAIYYRNNGDNTISLYASELTNGEHTVNFKIFSNSFVCKEYTYAFASYKQTAFVNKSATLSYGSADYQTITGISNVNKVICNGKPIAFVKSGNDLLIPNASIIECLDTVSGLKTSGTVRLVALSGDYNSTVTSINYSVTLSGSASIKSGYTNYTDETFGMYGYSSTGAGSSRNLNYEEQLLEYKRSGLDTIYEQFASLPIDMSSQYFSNYKFNENRNYQDLVRCDKLGLGCVIADAYTNTLCDETSSIYNRSIKLSDATTVNFTSTTDLYNALKSRYTELATHSCLKQLVLCDEPRWNNLTSVGEVYKQARKVLDDLGRSDVKVGVNLLPISAGYGEDGMGPKVSGASYIFASEIKKRHDTYINYLNKWLTESGADYVQYDIYPLNTYAAEEDGDNKDNRSGVDKFNYINIVTASEFAKSKGVELRVVTQTCTLPDRAEGTNTRIMSADDMRYLTNTLMGFGVKNVSYFTYYARHGVTESFNQDGGMMKENTDGSGITSKTTVWFNAQAANEEMNEFAKVVLNFEYQDFMILKNGSFVNQGEAYTNAQAFSADDYSNFSTLSKVAIDNGYSIVTSMKDSSNKYMFMVQNVCDPLLDARAQTVTMTFKSGSYAVIYENGQSRVVNLTSNKLTLKLSSGTAAYVMVY